MPQGVKFYPGWLFLAQVSWGSKDGIGESDSLGFRVPQTRNYLDIQPDWVWVNIGQIATDPHLMRGLEAPIQE